MGSEHLSKQYDNDCSHIIVKRQPAASDLRLIMAISKTVTDLARVGDEAEKVARMSRQIHESGHADLQRFANIRHAADIALSMLHQALDAFARLDAAHAASVIRQAVGGAILVVEDEPAIQELIAVNLEHAGHQVLRAANVPEAEALVREVLPDLVLLD